MSQIDITKNPTSLWMDRNGPPSLTSPLAADVSSLNPISLIRRFTDEMDRLFGSTMGRLRGDADFWMPALEMTEHDGRLMISAEVPGLRKEDMKVEITKDALILQGERKRGHRERHEGFYQS
jgi:HSP20 family protein